MCATTLKKSLPKLVFPCCLFVQTPENICLHLSTIFFFVTTITGIGSRKEMGCTPPLYSTVLPILIFDRDAFLSLRYLNSVAIYFYI